MYDIPTGLIVDHNNDTAFCKGCRCNKDLCEFEIAPKKIRLALKCKECRDVEAERNRKHRLNKTLGNTKPRLKRTGEERAPKIDLDSRKLPPNFKMSDYSSKDHSSKELEYDGKLIKYCQSCTAFHELCHFIDPKSNVEYAQCNLQRNSHATRGKANYHNNIEEISERRRERYAENPVEANERNKKYRTPERLQQYNANRRRKHAENPEHNRALHQKYRQRVKERENAQGKNN
ncbi:uncharacterized protein SAPINGB_P001565 [Magnusiomyces paraingens]|uniref:Uncharacterized protein n=1 Tax=Magnusiomyces paraingens TaxID=2606893 RepID=A0A5E8B8K4_9ASCO|nr:uncharacterized protein SAPINGB_P001565 [Saprochaete ingens]VVT47145.1 unnamed protein product [Saprochaete ingens]